MISHFSSHLVQVGRSAVIVVLGVLLLAGPALAGPRSGASFGGRGGFRSGSSGSSFSRSYSPGRTSVGGGTNFVVMPSFGWGFMPFGFGGGGGGSLVGTMMLFGIVAFGLVMVSRALRRGRRAPAMGPWSDGQAEDDRQIESRPDRAFVYKLQLGIGRSGRSVRDRLEKFAAEGDTSSEAGLASLLSQTALELLREKDSIRYSESLGQGPLAMTNAETKMNGLSLTERSRFQVERIRGADGKVRRSEAAGTTSTDALELLVVTLVIATRTPLPALKNVNSRESLEGALAELGAVPADGLLGLEVIWTPADPEDALTESDLLTTYPNLAGI